MSSTQIKLSQVAQAFRDDFNAARSFWNSLKLKNLWTWNTKLECRYNGEMPGLLGENEVYVKSLSTYWNFLGHGGRAVDWLGELADKHGVTLVLHSDPKGREPLKYEELMAFYERRGFVCIGAHGLMKRAPKSPLSEGLTAA